MKKIVSFLMIAAAFIFSSCSNDETNPDNTDGGVKTGMTLKATVAGQGQATRATMSGEDEGTWTFSFEGNDVVKVGNSAVSGYYTFTKGNDDFVSTDAKTTAQASDWYAYFPGNEVSLADQDGSFAKVANCFALAGKTSSATTGNDGLSIELDAQVAVICIVKTDKAETSTCNISVQTADGKYVSGLKAKTNEAGFDVVTSDSKVLLLSGKQTPGAYYIAVPAGIKLTVYNNDKVVKTTKDAGLTAGKYYTLTTEDVKGQIEINGEKIDWVQMWPGGPKIANKLFSGISLTDAENNLKTTYEGKLRIPTKDEMNMFTTHNNGSLVFHTEQTVTYENDCFVFKGNTPGYKGNVLSLKADRRGMNIWSSTEVENNSNNAYYLNISYYDTIYGYWMSGSKANNTNVFNAVPVVNE